MKKDILITGSTDGIGKLAAVKFAAEGQRVYIHGRNSEKTASVVEEIKDISNNNDIEGFVADFAEIEAVRKMSEQILGRLSKIDILINNAGVFKSSVSQSKDGLDIRFAVNYLAPYLLTKNLLPLMKNTQNARIVNLSSAAQTSVKYESLSVNNQLNGRSPLTDKELYAQSKLALTMWSFRLAAELDDISVLALNPGSLLNTKMVKEAYGKFWSPADKGADIIYETALSEKYANISGKYFDNDCADFAQAHKDSYDENEIEKLLSFTKNILGE